MHRRSIWLRLFLLTCLSFSSLAARSSERQIILDNHFQRGFILWEPAPGKHIKYGEITGIEPNTKPVWGLSQWSSKYPLKSSAWTKSKDGTSFTNAAKIVTLYRPGSDLSLAVNTSVEYGLQSRRAGEPWVHLLVEQEFHNPPFLNKLTAAIFHIEARLLRSTKLHQGDYDPGIHAAQFQVFFTVQNRNPNSPGHGDLLWFGIPIYDNRHRQSPEFKSRDFGGTGKFIFTPAATNFSSVSTHDGNWIVINHDLFPLMREALDMAWAKGFLAASTHLADYAIGGMNMGWELPGLFEVEIETRKLSLNVIEATGPPIKKLPLAGETFLIADHPSFLIPATSPAKGKPWVWYAPALPAYPGTEERWMFERFTNAGISIGGMDVGESYGSPAGRKLFTAFYNELQKRGYSAKPFLLGRSRGGLMTLSWAAENPNKVSGFAGIYPVCNIASYPGIKQAAPAYQLTAQELQSNLLQHNPIDRLSPLAKAQVPLFVIHGDSDAIVPLHENSGLMHQRYWSLGGSMYLIVPSGQGHNMWEGFFQNQELVDFVISHAR